MKDKYLNEHYSIKNEEFLGLFVIMGEMRESDSNIIGQMMYLSKHPTCQML